MANFGYNTSSIDLSRKLCVFNLQQQNIINARENEFFIVKTIFYSLIQFCIVIFSINDGLIFTRIFIAIVCTESCSSKELERCLVVLQSAAKSDDLALATTRHELETVCRYVSKEICVLQTVTLENSLISREISITIFLLISWYYFKMTKEMYSVFMWILTTFSKKTSKIS